MTRRRWLATVRDLYDLGRAQREPLLRWVADTGLAMLGLLGLLSGPGLVFGWNHHLHLGSSPGQGGALAGATLVVCVAAVLTWGAFALHYVAATRVGVVLLAVAAVVVAVSAAVAPGPGPAAAASSEALVAALGLVTLLGFCPAIWLSAPTPSRRDTRDRALPKLVWAVALPFYLLTYGLVFTAMYVSLSSDDSVFVSAGDPRSAIGYAIAVLGFAVMGTVRSRATSVYAALAASAATALCLPLALDGVLLAWATDQPGAAQSIALALMVLLIPALLGLARHRAATPPLAPLAQAAATTAQEGSE